MASLGGTQQLGQENIDERYCLKNLYTLSNRIAIIFCCLLISACAATPRSFNLVYPENKQPLLFPDSAQPARYQYLGDLIGEFNFPHIQSNKNGFWRDLLKTLTGIERDKNENLLLRPVNGLTLKNNNHLVADAGRHAIYLFDVNNNQLDIWKSITKSESFINPVGISIGPDNSILISDSVLGEVFAFDQQGNLLFRFGKPHLKRPTGLAYHSAKELVFVVDTKQHQVIVFDKSGTRISIIGGNSQQDSSVEFNRPTFIAVTNEHIFVTDTMNTRVVKLTLEGKLESIIGQRGYQLGDLNRPKGIAIDSDHNIYVVESYFDYLLVYSENGQLLLPLGGTGNRPGEFYLPSGVWIDHNDRVYVADMANGRVSIFQYLGTTNE